MNRESRVLVTAAASGGLLAAAFLSAAAALADSGGADGAAADVGSDAFTIGGITFDPMTDGAEGFNPVYSLSNNPPLLDLGGGVVQFPVSPGVTFPVTLAPQSFDLSTGTTDLGSVDTHESVTNLLGMTNLEFTVDTVTAADGADAAQLPEEGTVYDVLNLGSGIYNVYTATPGEDGAVTDTLVTPLGNIDLGPLFADMNAANPLAPGEAFTGLEDNTSAGSEHAFAIGGTTFDPGGDGFSPVDALAGAPPLLNVGGGILNGTTLAGQDLSVYDGTGADSTELGSISTGVDATNLLGLSNTSFTVVGSTPADGTDAADLPEDGTVYDVLNLGNGWENVYVATPGEDGAVTDTLVTPFGNIDLDPLFAGINVANPMDPGDAFTGLLAGGDAGEDAFTIDGTTFDPFTESDGSETEGFAPVSSLLNAGPLLNLGGGAIADPVLGQGLGPFAPPQDFNISDADGTDLGTISSNESVLSLFGLTNTQFTVTDIDAAEGVNADQLPEEGTVYDVFNFGNGWENVYVATPGEDGTVTDTFVTPFGNIDLSSLFDFNAANPMDPADAVTGLDDATDAAPAASMADLADIVGL